MHVKKGNHVMKIKDGTVIQAVIPQALYEKRAGEMALIKS